MPSLLLIHWNVVEAENLAAPLRAKWDVTIEAQDGARAWKIAREAQPAAILIYHTRLPSHGRATAAHLAGSKSTHDIPQFIIGGSGDALEKTKKALPGARFLSEDEILPALNELKGRLPD